MLQPLVELLDRKRHAVGAWSARDERELEGSRPGERSEEACAALRAALELLDRDRPRAADELLTTALLGQPDDVDLWLAAGIARLRRGAWRSARAALQMCVWLAADPVAEQLLAVSSSRS